MQLPKEQPHCGNCGHHCRHSNGNSSEEAPALAAWRRVGFGVGPCRLLGTTVANNDMGIALAADSDADLLSASIPLGWRGLRSS
jgi:hypothetical protein